MNWISFVKDYQSKNNISFKKAMKEAAPSYRKMKESKGEPNKKIKIIKDKKKPVKKKVIKIVKDKKEPVKKKVIKIVKDKKEPVKEKKMSIEEIRQLYQKDTVINEGTLSYPNKKGEMMRIRLPKFDEVFLKKPLRDLGKDREDFLEGKYLIKKMGGGLYKSFTEKEVKQIFPQNSANAIINYIDKYRKKIIFRREAKEKSQN